MPVEVGGGQTFDRILWKWRQSASHEREDRDVGAGLEEKAAMCPEPQIRHVEISMS